MTFYKYRHRYASHIGQWEYVESFADEEELTDDLMAERDGEHYRGLTIEKVDRPPSWWLEQTVKTMHEQIVHWGETALRYQAMLHGRSPEEIEAEERASYCAQCRVDLTRHMHKMSCSYERDVTN